VVVLIKKFSYDFAKTPVDKGEFIDLLLGLMMGSQLDFASKDLLGSALEYQFIEDQSISYLIQLINTGKLRLRSPLKDSSLKIAPSI